MFEEITAAAKRINETFTEEMQNAYPKTFGAIATDSKIIIKSVENFAVNDLERNCLKCQLHRVCSLKGDTWDALQHSTFIDWDKPHGGEWVELFYALIASRCIEFKPQPKEPEVPQFHAVCIDTPFWCAAYSNKEQTTKCDAQCGTCRYTEEKLIQ